MEVLRAINADQSIPQDKFTVLIDTYSNSVYRFCRSLTFSKEDADDLFQETFLKAFENQSNQYALDNPQGFLLSTSLYIWKSWKRKYARRNRLVPMEPLDENMWAGTGMEDDYVEQEEIRRVRQVVKALPDKFKIPIILHYAMDMNVSDMAAILKLPAGTVKSRLFKARKLVEKGLV